jgi:Subtilase family
MDRQIGRQRRRPRTDRMRIVIAAAMLAVAVVSADAVLSAAAMGASLRPAASTARVQLPVPPRPASTKSATTPFRSGLVLVGFHAGVPARERASIERRAGALGSRRLGPTINPSGHGRVVSEEFLAPFGVQVPAGHELSVVGRLRQSPAVAYAEPDYVMSATALTPNDPSFSLQWGDSNTGQVLPLQEISELLTAPVAGTPGVDDGALKAWQQSTGSRSIVIGETDTGVDYTHPDLAANIWSNPGNVGGCRSGTHGYNVVAQTCNPMDEDATYGGHGTHVAGIIGAVGNNGIGVAGMNWQTSILPVKWMSNAAHGETSSLIEALQWLVAAKQAGVNIRVVNNSDTFWGTAYSQALSNEIDVLGANNILFVASAGNTGNNDDEVAVQRYPCSYDRPNEICVAASDGNDQLPSWANYGPHTVDLAAPGVSIYSTFRGGTYGYLTGSSMAAPQVSGAAALILSKVPTLSAAALKGDILQNVDHLPQLAGKVITGGRLDVCKAMPGCAGAVPKPPANIKPPAISGLLGLGLSLTAVPGTWTVETSPASYRWLRCDGSGNNCSPIAGAWLPVYVPTLADFGHTLRVQETATDLGGASAPAVSAPTAPVGFSGAPFNTGQPHISGSANVGGTLSTTPGNWSGSPTAFSYQWRRCDTHGRNCVAIALATTSSYTSVEADLAHTLRVAVTATNAAGTSAPASSSQTSTVSWQTPSNVSLPTIAGSAQTGQVLTAAPGTWSGAPTAFAYQWQRCESSGGGCQTLSATGASYELTATDVGHTLRVIVTASNPAGHQAATSKASEVVTKVLQIPANTAKPTISGQASVGQTLTANAGTWTESPSAYAYQWQRCDSKGTCVTLPNTTAQYTTEEADLSHTLRVLVTASNAAGSSTPATSNPTPQINWQTPANTALPSISGTDQTGQTLTASTGTWTGGPTKYGYQWQRCESSGGGCKAISAATGSTYTTGEADESQTLRVVVTATNPAGHQTATSEATELITTPKPAPVNTYQPVISGIAREGQTLTEVHGTWTNEPTRFAYRWLQCNAEGASCQPIAGATGQTYVPVAGDVGHPLEVEETAINSGGPGSPAFSALTPAVMPPQPVNQTPPSISGTPKQGQPISETHGTWTNEPTSYSYRWLRCDGEGNNCSSISGAASQVYVPQGADVGHTLKVKEAGINAGGSGAPVTSAQSAVVTQGSGAAFGKTTVGAHVDGGMISNYKIVHRASMSEGGSVSKLNVFAVPGAAAPNPEALKAVIYSDAGGVPGTLLATGAEATYNGNVNGSGWFELPFPTPVALTPGTYWIGFLTGATSDGMGYAFDEAEGSRAYDANPFASGPTEAFGTATIDSEQASIYATYLPSKPAPPANEAAPTITGTAQHGQTLTEAHGSWTNEPSSFTYQWLRCDKEGNNCAAIAGAKAQTYLLAEADVGHTVRVSETAGNASGTAGPVTSSATAVVS